MRRCAVFVIAAVAASPLPAAAVCIDDVAELERRLEAVEATSGSVELEGRNGTVVVQPQPGGAEPTETWFGAASSLRSARRQLDNARTLAEDGNEDGCMSIIVQTREIVDHLEQ